MWWDWSETVQYTSSSSNRIEQIRREVPTNQVPILFSLIGEFPAASEAKIQNPTKTKQPCRYCCSLQLVKEGPIVESYSHITQRIATHYHERSLLKSQAFQCLHRQPGGRPTQISRSKTERRKHNIQIHSQQQRHSRHHGSSRDQSALYSSSPPSKTDTVHKRI